jgi:hypothetical protein
MKLVRIVLALVVTALIAQTVLAQEKAAPKREGRRPQGGQMDLFRLPRSIELTDEQKKQIADLKAGELGKEVEAVRKELDGILTTQQKEARKKAMEGKTGREAAQAARAAVTLTDDQKAAMKTARENMSKVAKKVRDKINSLLTDDQKAKLKEVQQNRKKKSDNKS